MSLINANQTILVVDDSDDDYEALVRAFRINGSMTNPLHRCEDGQQALDYLFHRGVYEDRSDAVRPALILLDLNMPGIDGHRVLAEVKEDTSLKSIPVIIMTTSDDDRDIANCYQTGANAYIRKPGISSCCFEAVQRFTDFWLDFAILPDAGPNSSKGSR
ncbi:MAG: response regulator [Geminicoccaceae bacterium]